MPFVKIDTGILRSTLWFDRAQRDLFLTALFMAELWELREETPQLGVDVPNPTGWMVPRGWYGFVAAAGVGIAHVAQVAWEDAVPALKAMGEPEVESRSQDFDGRRMVRVNGGYIVLNYMKYRDRDYTAAERQMRYRARKRLLAAVADTLHGEHHGVTMSTSRSGVTPNDTQGATITDSRVQSTEYRKTEEEREEDLSFRPASLMTLWNDGTTPPIPKCMALSKGRKLKATTRLAEHGPDWWASVIFRINRSAFCRGRNDRGWVATFDWLIANQDNAIKVLEGKYDDRAGVHPSTRTDGPSAETLANEVRQKLARGGVLGPKH